MPCRCREKTKQMKKECAYCGKIGPVTKDHVPPKGIFVQPRPVNLITVPACHECHNQQTSRDDEYFRNSLIVREELSTHPDILNMQPLVMRSLLKPQKAGMFGEFINSLRLIEQVTPSGVFVKRTLGFEADMIRIRRVVQRTLNGLFYFHKKHRVPEGYDTLIFNEESLQQWPAEKVRYLTETIIEPLLSTNAVAIGDGAFCYRFCYHPDHQNSTVWILDFYRRARFIGLTVPPEPKS